MPFYGGERSNIFRNDQASFPRNMLMKPKGTMFISLRRFASLKRLEGVKEMRKYYSLILSILAVEVSLYQSMPMRTINTGSSLMWCFSDWSGLPMTELSFSYENGQNIKHASLVTDEANLYFYLNMAPRRIHLP